MKAYADEAVRLDVHRRAHEATAERLKERLLGSMVSRGEAVHDTPLGRVRVRHTQASARSC